jgi:hypothetical protein
MKNIITSILIAATLIGGAIILNKKIIVLTEGL